MYILFVWTNHFHMPQGLFHKQLRIIQYTEFVYLFLCTINVNNNIHFPSKDHRFVVTDFMKLSSSGPLASLTFMFRKQKCYDKFFVIFIILLPQKRINIEGCTLKMHLMNSIIRWIFFLYGQIIFICLKGFFIMA